MKRLQQAVASLACVVLLVGCFSTGPSDDQSSSGGSGSEVRGAAAYPATGSQKVIRFARNSTISPVVNGSVFLYPRTFVPGSSFLNGATPKVYTGQDGSFSITHVPVGVYVLEISDGAQRGKAVEVNVPADSVVVDVGQIVVGPTSSIQCRISIAMSGEVLYYVSLKGTRYVVRGTQSDVDITIGGIPAGVSYTVNIKVVKPAPAEVNIDNVIVEPGATRLLDDVTVSF